MYQATPKRKKRAQLAFVYLIMSFSVIAIVAVLVLVMLGYRFNRFDGRVEQGGLVQFDSRPSGATVTVDGTTLGNKTASNITLTTGTHTVTITKDGYSTWKKSVAVQAGGVLWLNYALLLPKQPATLSATDFPTASSAATSPDRKYLATIATEADPTVYVSDLNADTPSTTKVAIPSAVYTQPDAGKSQKFSLVTWDKDSRHGLVLHTYNDGKSEYIWLDLRGQDAARNITTSLGVDIARAETSLGDGNVIYVLTTSHELRRINLSNNTLTGPLVSNVAEFTQADRSTVTFATLPNDQTKERSIGYLTDSAASPRMMRTTTDPASVAFSLYIGKYYGDQYMVLTHGTTVEILTGNISTSDASAAPALTQVAKFDAAQNISALSFSPEGSRFVAAQYAGGAAIYDLELKHLSVATFPVAPTRPLDWLNGFHFATTTGGAYYYYDFDGTNGQLVASNSLDMPVALSENSKYLYHYATTPTGVSLQRTKLTTN